MSGGVSGTTIATVYRSPPRLVLLDNATGTVNGNMPSCADADDVFFDARRHRIYVSCGAGALDEFSRDAAGIRHLDRIQTSAGARTSLYVPELNEIYVAARAGPPGSDAAVLVFRPSP